MYTGIKNNLRLIYLLGLTAVLIFGTYLYSVSAQKSISDKVIRLHVIANSNLPEDQEVKLLVRDEILKNIGKEFTKAETKDEALKILYNKIPEIETISENTLKSEGMNYPVNAVLVKEVFPLKYYGAFCFPAGSYTALKVSIGEAKGKNWWCVLFPPLCLTDETFYNEGYEILSKTLSEKDLEIIDYSENEKKSKVNIKFFVVEKWQELLT